MSCKMFAVALNVCDPNATQNPISHNNCHDFCNAFFVSFPNGVQTSMQHATNFDLYRLRCHCFCARHRTEWCTYDRHSHDFWAYFDMVPARKSTCMLWATWHELLHSTVYNTRCILTCCTACIISPALSALYVCNSLLQNFVCCKR